MPGIKSPGRYGVKQITSSGFKRQNLNAKRTKGLSAPKLSGPTASQRVSLGRTMSMSKQVSLSGGTGGSSLPGIASPKLASLRTIQVKLMLKRAAAAPSAASTVSGVVAKGGRKLLGPLGLAGAGLAGALAVGTLRSPLGAGGRRFMRPRRPGAYGAGLRTIRRDASGATGFFGPHHTRKGSRVVRERALMNG